MMLHVKSIFGLFEVLAQPRAARRRAPRGLGGARGAAAGAVGRGRAPGPGRGGAATAAAASLGGQKDIRDK